MNPTANGFAFSHKGDEAKSIPAQCCAMPYVLNGEVYYNCSVNEVVSNDVGCYHGEGQSQWVKCQQPEAEGALSSIILLDLPGLP